MIKYRVSSGSLEIDEVEVESETECFVIRKGGGRDAKRSSYWNWFESKIDAKKFIISEMRYKAASLEFRAAAAMEEREKIKAKIAAYIESNPDLGEML